MITINATVILTILNFIVLVAVLKAILWEPLKKFLDERSKEIEESLRVAQENIRRSVEITDENDRIIKEARMKAVEVVEKAVSNASQESRDIIAQSRQQAHSIIESGKGTILEEAKKVKQDLRQEMASFVVDLAGRVVEREIKEQDHSSLITKGLESLEKEKQA